MSDEKPTRDEIIKGVRAIIQGYFDSATERATECRHGRMYFEDCSSCYDDALEAVLRGEPQERTLVGIGYLNASQSA